MASVVFATPPTSSYDEVSRRSCDNHTANCIYTPCSLLCRHCRTLNQQRKVWLVAVNRVNTPPTTHTHTHTPHTHTHTPPAEPGFFKANWLWMGKTLVKMNKREEGKKWLQKLTEIEPDDIDVVEV